MSTEQENLISQIKSVLKDIQQVSSENERLRQAIIIHIIETGQPIKFLSDLDFSGIDFNKVHFRFGDSLSIMNGLSRTPITDLETLKKVYGNENLDG